MRPWPIDIIGVVLVWLALLAAAAHGETVSSSQAVVRIMASECDGNSCGTRSYGSGTLVDVDGNEGIIVTCWHLFRERPSSITVRFADGRQQPARLVGTDETWDLAALVIAKPSASPIPIASEFPQVGDRMSAGGYGPDGRLVWQAGTAQGYARPQQVDRYEWLQLSGAARDGDSGGPVLNERGELAAVLWGTNNRVIRGAYCLRVRKFLVQTFPRLANRFGQRPAQPVGPGSPVPVQPTQPGGGFHTEEAPAKPPDCVTQEQFAALIQRVADMESTVGKLVAIAPPIPETPCCPPPPLAGPTLADHLDDLRQPSGDTLDASPGVGPDASSGIVSKTSPGLLYAILPGLLAALGWTGPPAAAAWVGLRLLSFVVRRRVAKRRSPDTSSSPRRPLNDDYAKQLAGVYALSGQSSIADATLGREYDRRITEAEGSSDVKLATMAKQIRRRVADAFFRIHGENPSPAEPIEE